MMAAAQGWDYLAALNLHVMANVKQHNLVGAREWWKHLRPFNKRQFWKSERAAGDADTANRLDDDYPYEDLMADICTEGEPCEMCLRSAALLTSATPPLMPGAGSGTPHTVGSSPHPTEAA